MLFTHFIFGYCELSPPLLQATKKPGWDHHMGHGAHDVRGSLIPASSLGRIAAFYAQLPGQHPDRSLHHNVINFGEITAYLYIFWKYF